MPNPPLYKTWADEKGLEEAVNELRVDRTVARTTWQNIAPGNVSIRDQFTRRDYERTRPSEAIPKRPKDIMAVCDSFYRRNGLVKNVVDMMADFTVQGIDLAHPNKRIEKFYQAWFKRVNGPSLSERISNLLYRLANTVVKRTFTKKLTERDRKNLEKGNAGLFDEDIELGKPFNGDRRIPIRYDCLNVNDIEVVGGELASFAGQVQYELRIPSALLKRIRQSKVEDQSLLNRIPADLRKAIRQGKGTYPLSPEKVAVLHYKKDDWQAWAEPMTYAVLTDLRMLEKLKLADLAALDGAISHIRVWKLGNLEHKLLPTDAAVNRLADMLINNVGGGSIDLIWGPDLQLQETSTDLSKFLGQEKYAPTLNAIYAGLGIPPTLTGSATQSGFTNNFISLRTLTERLNYGRSILIAFWEHEIKLVQRAMGFRFPAELVFERPVLTDEAAELALLVQLADRGLISDESLQERFRLLPDLETVRVRREHKERESGRRTPKAGPWHNPQPEQELKKIALQSGQSTPSQVGLDLEPNKKGEKPAIVMKPAGVPSGKQKGIPGQGRPKNKKDNTKRKQKRVVPRSRADEFINMLAWARQAQQTVADIVHPLYLGALEKKNLRQLTDGEADSLEDFKFAVLCNLTPGQDVNEYALEPVLDKPLMVSSPARVLYSVTKSKYVEKYQARPSMDDLRQMQAGVYVCMNLGEDNGQASADG